MMEVLYPPLCRARRAPANRRRLRAPRGGLDGARTKCARSARRPRDLLALADWLTTHGCTHVAMESTGVYWKPIWHVLEGHFELILANALQIRNVPGRKTDVNDATWIADLLAHGLIRGSFVPPAPDPGTARSHAHAQATGPRRSPSIRCASRRCSRTPT